MKKLSVTTPGWTFIAFVFICTHQACCSVQEIKCINLQHHDPGWDNNSHEIAGSRIPIGFLSKSKISSAKQC